MKVIGAGFGRTGTMSLKAALEQLGFGPSFHMIDIISHPETLPYWQAAVRGERVDWREALAGWESTVDWPGCTYWEEMAELWPDAKILLSVREPEAWYRSCLDSIYQANKLALGGDLDPDSEHEINHDVARYIRELIWVGTFQDRFDDKDFALEVFDAHNENVKRKVDPDRLLVYEIKQGWGPLCEFLQVPVPDTPLPHLNDTNTFRETFGLPALKA